MADYIWVYLQSNLLAVIALVLTLILSYHYIIERGSGVKLSKKYRNSIYEAQSRIFLNATQYLISGNKDLAIKEFLNAVDLNRETLDTYFALGGLFRSNGEIDKAISIHRSLIARENIDEATRIKALKELAIDFDKGGFVDKAINAYRDVLKVNRDQVDVIMALCRILEDTQDWDEALKYRKLLSKASNKSQAETISNILVQKSKEFLEKGNLVESMDILEESFRFAPSVAAKIMRLKVSISDGDLEKSKDYLMEFLKENPLYSSFLFVSLKEDSDIISQSFPSYIETLDLIKLYFIEIDSSDLKFSPSIVLSKIRLLEEESNYIKAYDILSDWIAKNPDQENVVRLDFVRILINLEKKDELFHQAGSLIESLSHSISRHFCKKCGYESDNVFWRCPQCHEWETIKLRWKI